MTANRIAKSIGIRPRSQNCTTDIEDEKNTMNAHVAAVSCTNQKEIPEQSFLLDQAEK